MKQGSAGKYANTFSSSSLLSAFLPSLASGQENTDRSYTKSILSRNIRHAFHCLALALVLPALFLTLSGQDITKGSISGSVRDASGAILSGVRVTLTSPYGDRTTVS